MWAYEGFLRNGEKNNLEIAKLLDWRQDGSWQRNEKSASRTRGLSLSTILPSDPPFRSDSTISQRSMSLSVHRTQRLWKRVQSAEMIVLDANATSTCRPGQMRAASTGSILPTRA